jgi:hypothetical protein
MSWIGVVLFVGSSYASSGAMPSPPVELASSVESKGGIVFPVVIDDGSDEVPPKNCADLTDADVRFPYATGSIGIYIWTQDCAALGKCSSVTCIPNKTGAGQNGGAGQPCKC